MKLQFERFLDMRSKFLAFTLRDLQTTGTLFSWAEKCGYTLEDVQWFCNTAPVLSSVDLQHYFIVYNRPEFAKQVKALEKRLPKDVRRELRRARLNATVFGDMSKRAGGCGCKKVPEGVQEVLF